MRQSSRAVAVGEPPVKRKCGRPRNPIPRHKRVSHINAEHRRRGKIQDGFTTLKNMVPKYDSSGRDSKADVLFKAVEHSRKLQSDIHSIEQQVKELRAERQEINSAIERAQTSLPEGQLFEEQPLTPAQRLEELICTRASEDWRYWIFGFFMKPLHKTFEETVKCETPDIFVSSVLEWAKQNMSTASLRSVALESFRTISTKTSIMNKPELLQAEAQQHCALARSLRTSTVTSQHIHHHSSTITQENQPAVTKLELKPCIKSVKQEPCGTKHCHKAEITHKTIAHKPINARRSHRHHRQSLHLEDVDLLDIKPKVEQTDPSGGDFVLEGFDTPSNYESASPTDLSPPCSSHYDSASVFSDLQDWDCSSVDQGYETPSVGPGDSPSCTQQFSPSPATHHHQYSSPSPDLIEAVCRSSANMSPTFPLPCISGVQSATGQGDQQDGMDGADFLQSILLDPADCELLLDSTEGNQLFTQSERHFLDTGTDLDPSFDFSVLDYDTADIAFSLPSYTSL